MSVSETAPPRSRVDWLTKVPAITATFWVIKVLSTTIGETFADFLSVNVGLGPAVTDVAMIGVLAVALTIQLRKRKYTPWIYWLCVVLVSIVGTQITDFFTDTLGVSLYVSTGVFAVILAVVFAVWHRQEGTLAIASVDTRRRETFYWAAILVTFALGTAAGDLATEALSLGFRNGVLIFGGLIAGDVHRPPARRQRGAHLLDRVRAHPSARRLAGRSVDPVQGLWWPRPRRQPDQRDLLRGDHRSGHPRAAARQPARRGDQGPWPARWSSP